MTDRRPSLFTRDDTFFGVCEALGEDLRIPANLFRLAFAGCLFFQPVMAIAAYLGVGVIVAASRWFVPNPAPAAAANAPDPQLVEEPLPLAA